jgi:hypothetical protein
LREILEDAALDFGHQPGQVHTPVVQLDIGNDAGIQRLYQGGGVWRQEEDSDTVQHYPLQALVLPMICRVLA